MPLILLFYLSQVDEAKDRSVLRKVRFSAILGFGNEKPKHR